jgi:hypothetical protein
VISKDFRRRNGVISKDFRRRNGVISKDFRRRLQEETSGGE